MEPQFWPSWRTEIPDFRKASMNPLDMIISCYYTEKESYTTIPTVFDQAGKQRAKTSDSLSPCVLCGPNRKTNFKYCSRKLPFRSYLSHLVRWKTWLLQRITWVVRVPSNKRKTVTDYRKNKDYPIGEQKQKNTCVSTSSRYGTKNERTLENTIPSFLMCHWIYRILSYIVLTDVYRCKYVPYI